jgi:hypothetical protein
MERNDFIVLLFHLSIGFVFFLLRSKSDLRAISYIFTPMDGGRTKVEVFYTKFISINVCCLNHVMLCACCSLASCWIKF